MISAGTRRARRRMLRTAALLGAGAAFAIPTATASAITPLASQVRVTFTGPDGLTTYSADDQAVVQNPRTGQQLVVWRRFELSAARIYGRFLDAQGNPVGSEFAISAAGFDAEKPSVAYNPHLNEFLVSFRRETAFSGEYEIYVQRLTAGGAEVGGDDARISTVGIIGNPNVGAEDSSVVYNEQRREYLVAWEADDPRGALVNDEYEIYVQRLGSDGAQIGTDDQRVSDLGPDGSALYEATDPVVAWNARRDEYTVAWDGDDDTAPYVTGEREVYVQRLSGDATELGPNDRRISDVGPPGNPDFDATDASIAYNAATDEYLVSWDGDDAAGPLVQDEQEIFVQRIAYDGTEVGTDDQRISDMGPDGDTNYGANGSSVSYDSRANEYLVAWHGDGGAPLADDHFEVYAQRLSASGAELDGNDLRVSVMPNEGDIGAGAFDPAVSYDEQTNQYQIVWSGSSTVAPLVANEAELYARRFGAGTAVTASALQCKVLPPPPPPAPGNPSAVKLSSGQLLINQRISQAAVRRANGVDAWFGNGVETRDLCQASITSADLYPGSVGGYTALPQTYAPPDPRPVTVAAAAGGNPSKVTLSVGQLLINQRISQAAIRRLNALKARLDGGLTGGDVKDGAVGVTQLAAGTRVLFSPVVATPPAASVTNVTPATPGDPGKVTLSATQLLINQRISQAAVRRANDLVRRLGDGISSAELRDGTLTAADLASGLPLSTAP